MALWCRWIVAFSEISSSSDPSDGRHYVFEGGVVVARIAGIPTRKALLWLPLSAAWGSAEDLDMNVRQLLAFVWFGSRISYQRRKTNRKISD